MLNLLIHPMLLLSLLAASALADCPDARKHAKLKAAGGSFPFLLLKGDHFQPDYRSLRFLPSLKTLLGGFRNPAAQPKAPPDWNSPEGQRTVHHPLGIRDIPGVGLVGGGMFRLPKRDVDDDSISIVRSFPDVTRLIVAWCRITDRSVTHITKLKKLQRLDLHATGIGDKGARQLSRLVELQELNLSITGVTNSSMDSLSKLKNLTMLDLSDTSIDDGGLLPLNKLKKLRVLHLRGTRITDAGLIQIAKMKNLKMVSIDFTKVTNGGFKLLKLARPDLKFEATIWWYDDDKGWLKDSNRYLGVPTKRTEIRGKRPNILGGRGRFGRRRHQ